MFNKKVDVKKINEVADLASKVLRVLYFLLIVLAVYVGLVIFKETKVFIIIKNIMKIVSPLFIGVVIAWLFDPFVNFLEKKGLKRVWGAIITYALLLLVLFLVFYSLIPVLIEQIKELIKSAPVIFETLKGWINDMFNSLKNNDIAISREIKTNFITSFQAFASDITTEMPKNFLGFVSKLFSGIGTFILGLIIGFFFIVNFDSTKKLFKFVPKKYQGNTVKIVDEINVSLRSYVKGAAIDCVVIFVLSSLGLWICGLKAPLLFGLFCAITNIIPYAGPYIGGIPAVIVGFTQNPMIGISSLIVIVVIQFLEGNFLQPLIMAKTTKLHPVTIILGLLIFGHFFGIIGMLISTPLISSFKVIFKFLAKKYELTLSQNNEVEI